MATTILESPNLQHHKELKHISPFMIIIWYIKYHYITTWYRNSDVYLCGNTYIIEHQIKHVYKARNWHFLKRQATYILFRPHENLTLVPLRLANRPFSLDSVGHLKNQLETADPRRSSGSSTTPEPLLSKIDERGFMYGFQICSIFPWIKLP